MAQRHGDGVGGIRLAGEFPHTVEPFQGPAHVLLAGRPVPRDRQLHLERRVLTDRNVELGRSEEHHPAGPGHRHGARCVPAPHQALDRQRLWTGFLEEIPDRPIQRPEALGFGRAW